MMHSVKYRIPAVVVKTRDEAVADRRQELLDNVLDDKTLAPDVKMNIYESGVVRRLNDENKLDRINAPIAPEYEPAPTLVKRKKRLATPARRKIEQEPPIEEYVRQELADDVTQNSDDDVPRDAGDFFNVTPVIRPNLPVHKKRRLKTPARVAKRLTNVAEAPIRRKRGEPLVARSPYPLRNRQSGAGARLRVVRW